MVKGISSGSTIITVISSDGRKSDTCVVNVKSKIIPVETITLNTVNMILITGERERLSATISPEEASDKVVKWSSSNSSVAIVDEYGNVEAKTAGTIIITATTNDGNIDFELSYFAKLGYTRTYESYQNFIKLFNNYKQTNHEQEKFINRYLSTSTNIENDLELINKFRRKMINGNPREYVLLNGELTLK